MQQRPTNSTLGLGALVILLLTGCGTLPVGSGPAVATVESADGSPIRYGVSGQGEPVIVFIHCWTCDHEFWSPQLAHFERTHRVAWVDLAGHGTSGSRREDYTMASFGEDVTAVVDRIGANEVILVGHSMGGPVAIEAAELLGDKVVGIVGVDTFYTPFVYPTSQTQIEGFVAPFKADFEGASRQMVRAMFTPAADPEVIEWVVGRVGHPQRKAMGVSAVYAIFEWHAEEGKAKLEKYADRLRNINGASTGTEVPLHESVTLIPGVGHFVAQVKPKEFNTLLERMVGELQAR